MRATIALAVGVTLLAGRASALFANEKARAILSYDRLDSAREACPDEATMRGLVAARLGYDPFVETDGVKLSIEFRPDGRDLVARVTRSVADGDKKGERTLRSSNGDCNELASSVSLAVALAIDPEALRATPNGPPTEAPQTPPAPPEPTPRPAPTDPLVPMEPPKAPTEKPKIEPKPKRSAPTRLGLRIDAGIVLGAGIVPGVSFGPRLGIGLDGTLWSLSAEGTAIVPGSEETRYGTVSASVVYGAIVPCLHPAFANIFMADLCVAGGVGAMSADATNVSRSFPTTNVYAEVGPRAGVSVAPSKNVAFRLGGDLGVALTRIHLNIDDNGHQREVWASPAVSFLGNLAVVFRFR